MDYIKEFDEKGVVFLKSVFTEDIIEQLNQDVRDFIQKNNVYTHIQKRQDVQEDLFFVNNTYVSLNSYQKMQYYYLPVIDNRGSHNRSNDIGMIDIYNIQKLIPSIDSYISQEILMILLKKITGKIWKLQRVNLHICSNVQNPISFHSDNFQNCIKCVIYLSNITEPSHGAPVFVEKTHKTQNNIKNEDVKIYLGNKGDILISYQSGLHKKLPQTNSTAGFLVYNFIQNG